MKYITYEGANNKVGVYIENFLKKWSSFTKDLTIRIPERDSWAISDKCP